MISSIIYLSLLSVMLFSPAEGLAAVGGVTFDTGTYGDDIGQYIKDLYNFGLAFVGAAAFVAILVGAVEYTASGGNASRQADAKDRILSAIYGIILLLFAVVILNTINPRLTELRRPGESVIQRLESVPNSGWNGTGAGGSF